MSRRPTRSAVLPIIILAAAVFLWAFDTYRQATPPRPPATSDAPYKTSAKTGSKPSKTGDYETFHGCTLAQDRGNDGDSFRVKLPDGRSEIIRLYFVDTPESAFKSYGGGENNHRRIAQQAAVMGGITPQQAVGIGKKAKAYTLGTLEKSPFTIHTNWDDPFKDRRYHAFVEVTVHGKPRFLHELLVEKGLARVHTKGAPLPDGTSEQKQKARLYKLQSTAKSNESGAWGL
jgi:endonuclease YncB( thermonuclease family)